MSEAQSAIAPRTTGLALAAGDDYRRAALMGVDVATTVLRRGLPVVVLGGIGDATLALAVETSAADGAELLAKLSGSRPKLLSRVGRGRLKALRTSAHGAHEPMRPQFTSGLSMARLWPDVPPDHAFDGVRAPVARSGSAALALAKLAGLLPAVLCAPVPTATTPDAMTWATTRQIPHVRADDVTAHQHRAAETLRLVGQAKVPLSDAPVTRLVAFRSELGGPEHVAIIVGNPEPSEAVLARMHSACLTGDLLGSLRCDCGNQLRGAIAAMASRGGGILVYLPQEGRGIGLVNKLRAYEMQDHGLDTIDANEELGFAADERIYSPAAQILRQLGFTRIRLMTNNPEKIAALARHGIEIIERVEHAFPANEHNAGYLRTKALRSGHLLPLDAVR